MVLREYGGGPSNRKDTVGFFEAVTIRQILDTEGVLRRGGGARTLRVAGVRVSRRGRPFERRGGFVVTLGEAVRVRPLCFGDEPLAGAEEVVVQRYLRARCPVFDGCA